MFCCAVGDLRPTETEAGQARTALAYEGCGGSCARMLLTVGGSIGTCGEAPSVVIIESVHVARR